MPPDRELVTEVQCHLCWWQMAGYSRVYKMPFRRLAPLEVPAILLKEAAFLSEGILPLRPLASFVCETARVLALGIDDDLLTFEAALAELRKILPGAPDDEPAAPAVTGAPHG